MSAAAAAQARDSSWKPGPHNGAAVPAAPAPDSRALCTDGAFSPEERLGPPPGALKCRPSCPDPRFPQAACRVVPSGARRPVATCGPMATCLGRGRGRGPFSAQAFASWLCFPHPAFPDGACVWATQVSPRTPGAPGANGKGSSCPGLTSPSCCCPRHTLWNPRALGDPVWESLICPVQFREASAGPSQELGREAPSSHQLSPSEV